MQIIEYDFRNGKDRLKIFPFNGEVYICKLEIFCPRSPQINKWNHIQFIEFKTKTEIIKYVLEKDPNINLDYLINIKEGNTPLENLQHHCANFLLEVEQIIDAKFNSPKFQNNTKVRLTGYPNGLGEYRGVIGDEGIIVYVNFLKNGESWSNTLPGHSYMIKSPSFKDAISNELWVHESNLERI